MAMKSYFITFDNVSNSNSFPTYLTGDWAFVLFILSNYWRLNKPQNEQKRSHFLPEGIIYGPFLNLFKNNFASDSLHLFVWSFLAIKKEKAFLHLKTKEKISQGTEFTVENDLAKNNSQQLIPNTFSLMNILKQKILLTANNYGIIFVLHKSKARKVHKLS